MSAFVNTHLSSSLHPGVIINSNSKIESEPDPIKKPLEINLMTDTKEKTKWLKKFIKAYRYEAIFKEDAVSSKSVKFLKACSNNKTIGFLRLIDMSDGFKTCGNERIFFAADAYVLKQWRGIGVLSALLHEAINNYQTHAITLEPKVAQRNWIYYYKMGFGMINKRPNNGLWDLMDSFAFYRK